MNMKRIFVGNLPPDVRTRDLEDLFYKFGKIAFIDLKTRRGPPFAFVEFDDYRDAEEAVRCRDGKEWDGCRLRVEFPRGRERASRFKNGSGSGSRSGAPQRRSKFRVKVSGLPNSGSWQDLKDHMREVGEVCYADVYKGGEGVVEFVSYDDMRYAIKKMNNTKFKSHEGESSYIKLREDLASGDSRSRSRSPVATRRRASPSYSPVNKRRGDSHSPSRSISRSPKHSRRGGPGGNQSGGGSRGTGGGGGGGSSRGGGGGDHHRSTKRSSRHRSGRSGSRSRSVSRSQSHSRSPSGTPRSHRGSSPAGSRGQRSRSRSKSNSRSPRYDRSPVRSSDKRSRSNSRSPSPADQAAPGASQASTNKLIKRENTTTTTKQQDNNHKNSRSRSRSKSASRSASRSPINSHKTPSKTPSRTPTPDSIGSPKDA